MNYFRFINLYKQNSLAKKKYYYYIPTKNTYILLNRFINLGLIKYVKTSRSNNNILKIFINYTKNENIFKTLKILYKQSKNCNVKLKTLILMKSYKQNSTYLLHTPKGIITNFEAIQYKIGGILLCKINY